MRWSELGEEACSVARTVSVIGDRWTLLVLRDCFLRIRRFEDFQARLGITRPVLADRLRKLVAAGVLEKVAYQQRPIRHEYRLTEKGLELWPALVALMHWGDRHLSGDEGPPAALVHRGCGGAMTGRRTCAACDTELGPRDVEVLGAGASVV